MEEGKDAKVGQRYVKSRKEKGVHQVARKKSKKVWERGPTISPPYLGKGFEKTTNDETGWKAGCLNRARGGSLSPDRKAYISP